MNKTAQFMIHNPKIAGLSEADATELRSTADQLDKIKSLLIDVYQQKTGLDKDKLWQMYDNETWLTADEAGPSGFKFIDDVQDTIRAVAKVNVKPKQMESTLINKVENMLKRVTAFFKYKNMFTETTKDGKTIQVMSEDEDWTGKPIMFEDGSPVPPGEYELASGKKITVDEGSTITEVSAGTEPPMEDKVKELEAKLKASEEALAAANAATQGEAQKAAAAEAKAKTFENSLKTIQKDLEEVKKTYGTQGPPKDGFKQFMNHSDEGDYDPMGEDYKKMLVSREIIK